MEAESGQRRQKTSGGGRKWVVEAENGQWRQRQAVEAEDGWKQKMGGGGSKQPAVCGGDYMITYHAMISLS